MKKIPLDIEFQIRKEINLFTDDMFIIEVHFNNHFEGYYNKNKSDKNCVVEDIEEATIFIGKEKEQHESLHTSRIKNRFKDSRYELSIVFLNKIDFNKQV